MKKNKKVTKIIRRMIKTILYLYTVLILLTAFLNIFIVTVETMDTCRDCQEANIIDINDKKVTVQAGEKNGDPLIYELKNIKILHLQKGKKVYIKVVDNKAEYTIQNLPMKNIKKLGDILINIVLIATIIPVLIASLMIVLAVLVIPIIVLKNKEITLEEKISTVSFCVGLIMMVVFSELTKSDLITIISLILMIVIPITLIAIKEYKKKKNTK